MKPQKERKPRPKPRYPRDVAFVPAEHPILRVAFSDQELHLHHDGSFFRTVGVRYRRGGPVFDAAGIEPWDFTDRQREFVTAIMAARLGVAAEHVE
jgi:hypothetical protein